MLTREQENIIKNTVSKYNPSFLGVFGSYARGDYKKESDLDLLIEFNEIVNLLEVIGLEQELSEKLGIKVDLVTRKSLSKYLRPYIEKDLQRLL